MTKKTIYKKLLLLLTVFATVFLSGVLVNHKVSAADYEISRYQSKLAIHKNDNIADFSQELTYRFDGEHNGVFINQLANAKNEKGFAIALTSLEVFNASNSSWQALHPANGYWTIDGKSSGFEQDPFYAQLISNPDGAQAGSAAAKSLQVKLFDHVLPGQEIRVRLAWRFTNLIAANSKIDELNWLPISNWQADIRNFSMQVQLPDRAKTLRAWVHTPAGVNGRVDVKPKQGRVLVSSPLIPANRQLEIHSYWNKAVTQLPPLHKNNNRASEILKQESAITFRSHVRSGIVLALSLLLAPVLLLLAAIKLIRTNLRLKKDYKLAQAAAGVDRPVVHDFDIPNDLGPAVIAARLSPDNFSKSDHDKGKLLSATFMDLIARKNVKINSASKLNSKHILFNLANKDQTKPFEDTLLSAFFDEENAAFDANQLKNAQSKVNKKIRRKLPSFVNQISQEADKFSIVDPEQTDMAKSRQNSAQALYILASLLGTTALVVAGFILQSAYFFLFVAAYLVIAAAIYLVFRQAPSLYYTSDGFQEKYRWDGFKSMLHDIGHFDARQIQDVAIWDRILAYAVVFDEAERVAKYLRSNLAAYEIKSSVTPLLFAYYYFPMWQVDNNFVSSSAPTPSNISNSGNWTGGGGGFSSGGGFSGGGGGGGGGAF
ncbi:DUF2207 family protein [Oenococcus sp.]|uniref:DUF2207 family protein n=1 Tax=Oenococcus sp. TaxID=1979414 RepID=UPI0039ECCA05